MGGGQGNGELGARPEFQGNTQVVPSLQFRTQTGCRALSWVNRNRVTCVPATETLPALL